jgi:hypothetical protein
MTDPLTDAVRRLKGLQEDVERLKAAQNEEGEPRIFIQEQDAARASDTTSLRAADIAVFEAAQATDAQQPLVSEAVRPLYWGDTATGWNAAAYPAPDA